jgi:hypothetical protein
MIQKHSHNFLTRVDVDSVFVEIGSAFHEEGSTNYFGDLAQQYSTILHTVDMNSTEVKKTHLAIVRHTGIGSEWCANYGNTIGKKISCLYLDNFDYIWDVEQIKKDPTDWIAQQVRDYKSKYNIDMNNNACQVEHMNQILSLTPYLADNCVVTLDDTYTINDCWVGKCGPVVVYLQTQGFKIVRNINFTYEAILKRGD